MKQSFYNIAGVTICIDFEIELIDDPHYAEYRIPSQEEPADMCIRFERSSLVPDFDSMECLFQGNLNRIFRDGNRLWHVFHAPGDQNLAWNPVIGEASHHRTVYYEPDLLPYFSTSTGCFNALSIERVLHTFGKYIFHCCYVETQGTALLFTAPSGGGKTTHGSLWEASGHGRIINGDRAVLSLTNQPDGSRRFYAHGLPIAGSSDIFINEVHPLGAIFVVNKSSENSMEPLTGARAFSAIYEQFIIHLWDPEFQMDVLDFVEALLNSVPVYRLNCRIDPGAVDCILRSDIFTTITMQ